MLAAQLLAVDNVEKALASGREPDARLERLLRWAVDAGGVAAKLRGPLADALLRPWLSRPVPDPLKQRIQDFLLQHYGDPRTKQHRWAAASDEARQVFRKWLARVALAQFLEVIDRLALDRQWKYRRAFWTAYFDRDWVWDAQVAFGPGGAELARQLFGRDAPFADSCQGWTQADRSGPRSLAVAARYSSRSPTGATMANVPSGERQIDRPRHC